jgi:hypothetical protein
MKAGGNPAGRRAWLKLIGASGILGPAGWSGWMSEALAAGSLGGMQGVNRLDGSATVNGKPAKVGTPVALGDRVATARGSQAVVVINDDAFLMRGESTIDFKGSRGILSDMVIATGKVLSVFGKKPVAIKAASASIGIRGTGGYIEVEPKRVYFCLCYGEADIDGPNMSTKAVKTTHHESPLFLLEDGGILRAEPGPFLNHTDEELVLLESLVGREPPFMQGGQYPSKKY